MSTQTKDIRMAKDEKRVHGAKINGTSYIIGKKLNAETKKHSFTLYEYIPAQTLKNKKSALKPLYSDSQFGNVTYEMFRRGFGL